MNNKKQLTATAKQQNLLNQAVALHQSGQLDAAEIHYKKLLKSLPSHIVLLSNLATIAMQKGNVAEAVKIFERSLQINPNQPYTLFNNGVALQNLKRLDDALLSFDLAIALKPDYVEAYFNRGVALHELKRFDEALEAYKQALVLQPDNYSAYFKCGLILQEHNCLDEALANFDCAIGLKPDYVDAYINRGNTLYALNRLELALESYEAARVLNPACVELYCNRGVTLHGLKRLDEALASYDDAIALKPDYADAYSNRGNCLYELKRLDEALVSYDLASALKPDNAVICTNRGNVLQDLNRLDDALLSYDLAIVIKPDHAEAYANRGNALQELKRLEDAVTSYDHALVLNSDNASAYFNRGVALRGLKRLDEALISFNHALALKPTMDFVLGYAMHAKMHLCLWDDLPKLLVTLTHKIKNNEKVINPFPLLSLIDDPSIQRLAAEIYVNQHYPKSHALPKIDRWPRHSIIRLGYFSADFNNHPVAMLTAELYETHDRNQFEIYAFSYGPDTKDEQNVRIKAGVDHFYDVGTLSDKELAILSRTLEIDIAVDLGGFTVNSRTGIFAMQAAPIQLSYIGYLGTLAAKYYDYLVADKTIIPEKSQAYYAEKIVYLPSYQVNDSKQLHPTTVFTRQDIGLPETGFVFCCFNNTYKITPTTFDSWVRILKAVDGSVLLLYADNEAAKTQLTQEIVLRNMDPSRFVFGKRLPTLEYLARYRVADLFLDTLPYNAGTTASDALRMGLPVLTCMGESFASRVAASLLNAINLLELITSTQQQYESLAIELATHPEKLKIIKAKLASNLSTAPLYDTPLFTRHLESAYLSMYDNYQNGLEPDHIYVESL